MDILLVDDDNIFRKHMSKALIRRGYTVIAADNGEDAVRMAAESSFDAAFVDMKMPGMSGIDVIRGLKKVQPQLKSIILTGYGSISAAVDAIKVGAYNYITKPCEIEDMETIIREVYQEKSSHIKKDDGQIPVYHGIVGKSRGAQGVVAIIQKVKDSPFPVLICGESGTGKELVARAVHFDSARKEHPFIAVNCASLKPELLENELFGHIKGAFTGATTAKDGLLKVANRGTLFIDEIADMNPAVQASLLRFLETGIFRPLGSTVEMKVDVRIIAAINRDVEQEVAAKRFRHDLYYRLNVCRIDIPPLKDRKDDIPLLVKYFFELSPLAKDMSFAISQEAVDALMAHHWPGNIRELFNTLNRAMLLSKEPAITEGLIHSLFPCKPLAPNGAAQSASSLDDMEKRHLLESLSANNWNISRTASVLGIDRRTLQRKIARYRISRQ